MTISSISPHFLKKVKKPVNQNKPLVTKRIFPSSSSTDIADEQPVTFTIRTDAGHAADLLIKKLVEHVGDRYTDQVKEVVKEAYGVWGEGALEAFSRHFDPAKYNQSERRPINVEIHDDKYLAETARLHANALLEPYTEKFGIAGMSISLDDMISPDETFNSEIAFSRLFSLDGTQLDYVERPGRRPLPEQLAIIYDKVKAAYIGLNHTDYEPSAMLDRLSHLNDNQAMRDILLMADDMSPKVPIVFLEDNVRKAGMLTWIIDEMEKAGIFKYATLAGISTCFCNAAASERDKITFHGRKVKVESVIEYDPKIPVDVTTTRDLMFDGFVVRIDGQLARLPGIFMDVSERFKIEPSHADDFRRDVAIINKKFCANIEHVFGIQPQLSWFDSGTAIAHVTGKSMDTPMVEVMDDMLRDISSRRVVPMVRRIAGRKNVPS